MQYLLNLSNYFYLFIAEILLRGWQFQSFRSRFRRYWRAYNAGTTPTQTHSNKLYLFHTVGDG